MFMQIEWKMPPDTKLDLEEGVEPPESLYGFCVKTKYSRFHQYKGLYGVAIVDVADEEETTEMLSSLFPSFRESTYILWVEPTSPMDFDDEILGQLVREVVRRSGNLTIVAPEDREYVDQVTTESVYGGRVWKGYHTLGPSLSRMLRSFDYVDSGKPIEVVDVDLKWFWLSWWEKSHDYRPLTYPPHQPVLGWWKSGENEEAASIVAMVAAESEDAAWSAIDLDWPLLECRDKRFCEQVEKGKLPSDRFPLSDWMKERFNA